VHQATGTNGSCGTEGSVPVQGASLES
jgi:hypothetical protein